MSYIMHGAQSQWAQHTPVEHTNQVPTYSLDPTWSDSRQSGTSLGGSYPEPSGYDAQYPLYDDRLDMRAPVADTSIWRNPPDVLDMHAGSALEQLPSQMSRSSSSEKQLKYCQICGRGFVKATDLSRHEKTIHREELYRIQKTVPEPFYCWFQGCRRATHGFTRKDNRDDHCRRIHKDNSRRPGQITAECRSWSFVGDTQGLC